MATSWTFQQQSLHKSLLLSIKLTCKILMTRLFSLSEKIRPRILCIFFQIFLADKILMICKGAESTIIHRSTSGHKEEILQHVNDFAVVRRCNVTDYNRCDEDQQGQQEMGTSCFWVVWERVGFGWNLKVLVVPPIIKSHHQLYDLDCSMCRAENSFTL